MGEPVLPYMGNVAVAGRRVYKLYKYNSGTRPHPKSSAYLESVVVLWFFCDGGSIRGSGSALVRDGIMAEGFEGFEGSEGWRRDRW